MTGYDRDDFGQAWSDDTQDVFGHNGCDTRNDVLRRDLMHPVVQAGTHDCLVLRGTLPDPYTGRRIQFQHGEVTSTLVQIDHVVALGDAWQTGAQQWSAEKKRAFANDPINLLAVDGAENERKGAGDAATWLPPARGFWCPYVARQTAVKAKYGLWMTAAEKATTRHILSACRSTRLPRGAGQIHARTSFSVSTPLNTIAPPPTKPPTGGACEPGYSPCLPVTYDLDCADIEDPLKPILVTGSDPYHLDGDGDHVGCESSW